MKELKNMDAKNLSFAEQEARILKSMVHENVIKYVAHFIDDDVFYLVLEYANSGDLRRFLRDHKMHYKRTKVALKKSFVLDSLVQMTCGLGALHKNNIIHRDLKPENVLIHKVPHGQSNRIQYLIDYILIFV